MPPKRLPTIPHPDEPRLPSSVSDSVGFLVTRVAGLFRGRVDEVMRAHRLHPRLYLVMQVLREDGTLSQQAVGQRTGMDRTTTMQAALALAEAGLVRREDDPEDRRVYRLSLTETGQAVVAKLEEGIARVEEEVLAPLPVETRRQFIEALRTLLSLGAAGTSCGGEGKG